MRYSEFHEKVTGEFGVINGETILLDHVLPKLGYITAVQAVKIGVSNKQIWNAICAEFNIPAERK